MTKRLNSLVLGPALLHDPDLSVFDPWLLTSSIRMDAAGKTGLNASVRRMK